MTGLAVTGYASLDYPISLGGFAKGDQTSLIDYRDPDAWPRLGGCASYVALAARMEGRRVSPICWVGANAEGTRFRDALDACGLDTVGVGWVRSERSPACVLIYQPDGSCMCLYDPAFSGEEELRAPQRLLMGEASHLCICVGPPQLTTQILASRKRDATLCWVAKNDRNAFDAELCTELSRQADIIFCNEAERDHIGQTKRSAVVIKTLGQRGVCVEQDGHTVTLPVQQIAARDTTGAGDTFAGGYISAHMSGEKDPIKAAEKGISAVSTFLTARIKKESS